VETKEEEREKLGFLHLGPCACLDLALISFCNCKWVRSFHSVERGFGGGTSNGKGLKALARDKLGGFYGIYHACLNKYSIFGTKT
jgi:hypothetical protein